jgi:hypothetical protein
LIGTNEVNCDVCGRARPADKIKGLKRDVTRHLDLSWPRAAKRVVLYCGDHQPCREGAGRMPIVAITHVEGNA